MSTNIDQMLTLRPEVQTALHDGAPLVALESTVITHGLAYPDNVETALAMERAVRQAGATPATIAILRGKIHVGLSESQLGYLAERPPEAVVKCSRRDLAVTVARGADGSTTVAGTMIIAHAAGIPVFATGGIGGVHRGHHFDVSADLEELGQTPVTVVCSGAKSILDLAATIELLETKGVPVLGYQTGELPAFFVRDSGLPVSQQVDNADEVAAIIRVHQALGLQSGVLVVVPVPETSAYDARRAEAVIDQATQEAQAMQIRGPQTTPWLLKRVAELSGGESVRANVALLRNNGRVAAQIAASFAGSTATKKLP